MQHQAEHQYIELRKGVPDIQLMNPGDEDPAPPHAADTHMQL